MSDTMKSKKKEISWTDYERIANGEYTDIILSKSSLKDILRTKKTSVRLPNYQISFLGKKYPSGTFSEALRSVIDQAIKINSKNQSKKRIE